MGGFSSPAFADLDGDGDLDLVVGERYGTLRDFENQTLIPRVTFAENATGTVFQRAATDPEGSAITWSLGGADAALFDISNDGAITFRAAPDFDSPQDQGGDNVYDLTVIASDGVNATPLALTVTVTDVNEAPAFAAGPTAATFAENGTGTVFQRAATDPEGRAITWSLGGADAALFDISSAGAVTFRWRLISRRHATRAATMSTT